MTRGVAGALAGDSNSAAHLDGGDDQVNMGDPADGALDAGTSDFSVEAWVKATANDERALISKRAAGSQPYWQVTVTDDGSQIGRIRVNVFDGAVARQAYGPAVRVDDGTWHHVVVSFDRDSGITIWVDGVSRATAGPAPGDVGNAGPLLIGKASGYGNLKGDVDEVAIYGSLLDPARVAAHYAAGRGG